MFKKLKKDFKESSKTYEDYWSVEIHPITGEVYFRPKWFKYWCVFIDILHNKLHRYFYLPYFFIFKPFKKGFLLYPEYKVYEEEHNKL